MDNNYVYFLGGPADLSKKAFPGRVPDTIEVAEIIRDWSAGPTDEVKYTRHTYVVRKLTGSVFVAMLPE